MTNFWEAIESIESDDLETQEPEYRVYYDKLGNIKYYSMEANYLDNDYEYIIISENEYKLGRYDMIVNNGKMIKVVDGILQKLVPSDEGVICDRNDITIITDDGQKWGVKRYV